MSLPDAPRILVIRLSAMGDVLLCFPAVRALHDGVPGARLTFLTDRRLATLLGGLEVLEATLTLSRSDLRTLRPSALTALWRDTLRGCRGGFDAVIDLQSFGETALLSRFTGAPVRLSRRYKTGASWLYTHFIDEPHPPCYMTAAHLDTLERAGLLPDATATSRTDGGAFFAVSAQARAAWRERLDELARSTAPTSPRVAMFVGAAHAEKRWPPAAFAELAARVGRSRHGRDLEFVVLAGPEEQDLAAATVAAARGAGCRDRIVEAGPVSLDVLAAAFQDAAVTVSNDTGPMHLSVATGTPTLALFHRRLDHFTPPSPHRHVEAPPYGDVTDIPVAAVESALTGLLQRGRRTS